ncbi:M16 family metallopeptidase [Streptomyces sp. NPDC002454]
MTPAADRPHTDDALPNGLRLVAVHTPAAPLAEIRLVLPWARTAPRLAAAQRLLAACLGTGARTPGGRLRTRQDIADRAADLGAELSTVVTPESLVLSAGVLAEGLPGALGLLADLLLRPVHQEREIALAHARPPAPGARPLGRNLLRTALLTDAFGAHPLLAPPAPDAAAGPPTAADLHALHRRVVVPAGSVLLITGDADPRRTADTAAQALADWSGGPSGLVLPPFARAEPRPGRTRRTDPEAAQALVLTAGPAARGDAALHLAQLVLGGHASGRLARRVRDRHGLAYAVSATLRENRAGAWLETEAAGAPGTADRIAAEVTGCLHELAADGPTPDEFERARAYALGFTRFALATRAEEATALAGFLAAGLPLHWLDDHRSALTALTPARVAEAAARFLDPRHTALATLDTPPAPPRPEPAPPASAPPEPVPHGHHPHETESPA